MKKRIISMILMLSLTLAAVCLGAVGASAADNTAKITVGGRSYTASVGDYVQYTASFTYTGQKLATAQIELPVDFTGLGGYTQSEADSFISTIAPQTSADSIILRSDKNSELGLTGYVMNFVSPSGYSFTSKKVVLSLIFSVEKAGSYDLAAKVRYVDDISGNTVIDKNYAQSGSTKLTLTEELKTVKLDTPKLSVATAAGGMKVSWDPVPRAALYRVYYKGSKGWTKLTDTKNTSVLDTDVVNGYRYTYTVRCLSADASRFTSDYDTAGKAAVYYVAPKLNLSNSTDSVSVSWSAVSGAAKYRVYRMGSSGWTRLTETSSTSYTDSSVTSGTTYTYTIRTLNSSGSFLSSYYTDGFKITFIKAPTVTLSNVADGVKISWDKVAGAAKYRVFYKGSKGWTRLTDTASTSFIDKDVKSNYNYTYTVRCINSAGTAYTSNFRSGKSLRYIAAPKLTLSNTVDGISVKWSAVSGATKYRVYYKAASGWTRLTDTASTSCSVTNVTSGTKYTYTIRCLDSNNNLISSYYTDGFSITFVRAPSVTVSNAADGVQISWAKVGGAAKYRVYYKGASGWKKLTDTTSTSFIDKDVKSGNNYTYTVRCINAEGTAFTSSYRDGKSIRYIAAPKLTLANASNGVSVKWSAVTGASKYRIYRKESGGWTKLTDTDSTSYTDTSAKSGTTYTYTIRCLDANSNLISYYYTDGFKITYTKA